MASNIEIKLRVADLNAVAEKAIPLANHGPELIRQEDVFFNATAGRLKLRLFDDGRGELIGYRRSDSESIRESQYHRYLTDDPPSLRKSLSMTLGEGITVRKERTLFLIGQTRIHLDRVESLGNFVELEVVMQEGETTEQGIAIANDLLRKLGLDSAERIAVAYADLLAE
jgi:adenylate cyclase